MRPSNWIKYFEALKPGRSNGFHHPWLILVDMGVNPKMLGFPNKPMGFPTKKYQRLGCEMGGTTI